MNPVAINSANIVNFGFSALFQLYTRNLHFDFSTLTTFQSGQAANVQGIYIGVTDPTGIAIKTIDLTTPDLTPTGSRLFDQAIPSAIFTFGWYTLVATIKDQDGTLTTITLKKNVCMPADFNVSGQNIGLVLGKMTSTINCYTPSIKVSEETNFTYNSAAPTVVTKAGNLYFPQGTVDPVAFTFTPFAIIGAGQVYTGDYLLKSTATAIYDLGDNIAVEVKYYTALKFTVVCNSSINQVLCCVEALSDLFYSEPSSERGIDAKTKLNKAAPALNLALLKEKVGQDAADEIQTVKDILDCDCATTTGLLDPIPLGVDNNNPQIIELTQAGGVTIDTETSGNTTNYTISNKIVQLTKDSGDLNFSITKAESQYGIVYTLGFDYPELSETMLNTIAADDGLISLLKGIIGSASNIDLTGLVNNCIINISTCNYSLIEANNIAKTIVSITINNTTHNAPSSLLLTNTSGIATWLNGLSLGTFSATFDGGSNTVSIITNANTNTINNLIYSISTVNTTRQFTRICANLVDVLNAITTYVCAIDSTEVKFGATGLQVYTINSDGVTINKADVSTNSSVAGVLTLLINAQNALINSLAGTTLNCTNVKALFPKLDLTIIPADGLLGTRNGQCSSITNADYAAILLTQISNSTDLQSQLCGLVANCSGAVCAPLTNPSVVYIGGGLEVNANGAILSSTPIKIFYRVNNSGLTFTEVDIIASGLPWESGSLPAAQYEVQLQQQCANGVWSPAVSAVSNNTCVPPVSFTVNISGSNFVVAGTLTSPQTKIELTMTDPSGGVTTTIHDFGATSGTFNVAIPAIYGNYTFKARAVCDSTTTPIFASNFTSNVVLNVVNPTANNFNVVPNYNLGFTDISNGTASGVPTAFNSATINSPASAYSAALSPGTISITIAQITGSFPGIPIYARLYKNGTTLIAQTLITAIGTYVITNTTTITAPDTMNINIES